jgi:hypothetical protein
MRVRVKPVVSILLLAATVMGAGVITVLGKTLLQLHHDCENRDNGYEQYELVHSAPNVEP